jgi:Uncharacterised nucleotidyltransferase
MTLDDIVTDPLTLLAGLLVGRAPVLPAVDQALWMELVALAQAEGVAPLLHQALAASCVEAPAPARKALAMAYFEAVSVSLVQQSVRERLCRRLAVRGIRVLLMKGAALAFTCYEDPATRPMVDLDVLVHRSQLAEAGQCLEEEGFGPIFGSLATALRSPWGELGYTHPKTGAWVELHWEFSALGRAQKRALAEIWSEARPLGGEASGLAMRAGHTIPFLCAHMIQRHQATRLLWLYDLHRVLLTADAEEATLAREAAIRWQLVPCTALTLLRVRDLFGTPLPQPLSDWARAAGSRDSLAGRMAAHALSPGAQGRPNGDLVDLVVNRNWSMLRACFPAPAALRERCGLSARESVLPAYLSLLSRYLRKAPAHCRTLWRTCFPGGAPRVEPGTPK